MNLFKVLASSKKGFSEEQSSVLIAWLLNPYMEHGLGFAFLNKFLQKIYSENEIMEDLNNFLQPILRNEKNSNNLEFSSDIEFYVEQPQSFIDIVIFINKILISIENKIRCESANKEQLARQYEGLKKKYGEEYKMAIIFLVPDSEHQSIIEEFKELKIRNSDVSKMITWDEIRNIIQEILNEEQKCEIPPINEYLRHTLKALSCFIQENFEGYYYETTKNYGNKNPLAVGRKTFDEIKQNEKIKCVGVNKGIIGLLSFESEILEKSTFQYTETECIEQLNWQWLKKEVFIKLCYCIKTNKYDDLDWIEELKPYLPANIIYNIAKNTNVSFYIGIQGGDKALSGMESDVIEKKRWSVSLKKETAQWINKDEFIRIIEDKSVYFKTSKTL
jgi:hypothetical protein